MRNNSCISGFPTLFFFFVEPIEEERLAESLALANCVAEAN
jgi:hypothetical protein